MAQPYLLEMLRVMKPPQLHDSPSKAELNATIAVLSLTFGVWSLCAAFLETFCIIIHFMSFPEKNYAWVFLEKS